MDSVSNYSESQIEPFKIKTSPLIRLLDLAVASCGLFLLVPIFLVIGLLIKLTSPGPVFYLGERVGQGGRPFKLYKFRSMVHNADRRGPGITCRNDPRITTIGRFLRHTKLDELPQLINVLKGEMSLVGPRPEDPRYVAGYTPEQRQLLSVRPGITSPASLYYREEETLLSGAGWEKSYRDQILPHKLVMDLDYLRQRTLWSDLLLILSTVVNAVFHVQECLDRILKLRNRHFLLLDLVVLSLLPTLALSLRLDEVAWWSDHSRALVLYTLVAVLTKTAIFYLLGLYRRYWCLAGVNDLALLAVAVLISTLTLTVLCVGLHPLLEPYCLAMYRTVPVIDGLLTGLIVSGYRFALRGLYHWRRRQARLVRGRRTLVVGAGQSGTLVVQEMRTNPQLKLEPVAFVDDDPAKLGSHIQGVPVLAACQAIPWLVEKHQIQRIIVAMPAAPLGRLQELVKLCRQTGVPTDCLPGMYELLAGSKTISPLPRIDINRLLHRQPVETDQAEVTTAIAGETILVTGAGGSIGRELCRQLARLNPETIILLGHGENSIFEINLDLRLSFPHLTTRPVIVDVRDAPLVNGVIQKFRPKIIFHAAAHKHVPFMEENVKEAVTNNVLGTQTVLQAAAQFGVERFVLISTDKAVKPTSIMGATKRIAELLVSGTAYRTGRAYMSVRFGNVLGSRGSVIPIFQEQIAAGGPVTVTHPDMSRYFMTIPEAVQLVLQASVLGQGGEVFVLDMGQPVRILDLATDLIKLSGYKPGQDIRIVFSGIRPGEKLYEELFLDGEDYRRTRHDKIFVARPESTLEVTAAEQLATELVRLATTTAGRTGANERMRALIPEICFYIDQYQPPARTLPISTEPAPQRPIRSVLRAQPSTPTG